MTIRYEKDAENIVTLTIDQPDRPVNVINEAFLEALREVVQRLEAEEPLTGVILTSAKPSFVAGADVAMLEQMTDPAASFAAVEEMKGLLRRLETLGKPVVAALNGTALGGGLEVALACHHRIAMENPAARFGFPEVTLGILPGGGGVTRLTRMLGLQKAFPYLAEGRQADPWVALKAGIVDELAPDHEAMLAQARAWIRANPETTQPWDRERFRIPGGDPHDPQVAQMVSVATAMVLKETHGNYPAPMAVLSAMVDGALVNFDTAGCIESRYFAELVTGRVAKNMIRAFWFQLNEINKGHSRPADIPPQDMRRVGVLGAGLMGHGIAYVTALAGMDVVLKDVSVEKAEAGKARVERLLDERVRRGRMTAEEKQQVVDRILTTANPDDLIGCDLIIEAVFEDRELKAAVHREAEERIEEDAVLASNTSTLPITSLAARVARPQNFIGIHFFSPVHRMKLVEIIVGRQTAPRTLAKAFDYVRKIGKVPIVVNDSRGFYTSRVFSTYLYEGLALLKEGQPPQMIEAAGMQAGMPLGPLALLDELSLGLAMQVRAQTAKDYAAEGKEFPRLPADDVLEVMVRQEKRLGKAQGAGFYEYPAEGDRYLWPHLTELFPPAGDPLPLQEVMDCLMFRQVVEAVRCYQEGVVTSVADANIGSIFGWGFAPFKGGVLQFVNDYGVAEFVARCRELAAAYGPRFDPPDLLIRMAKRGETFS